MLLLRDIYASKAITQIPRLLGNQDRNPFSPTYGCFHRDYWLDKTSDFPDAVRQFAVHALALVYKYDFPGNIYKGQVKVRDWAIAGLNFWTHIQHKDGSFDEFYPYERGWSGPTAFTTYTSIEAYRLLKDEMPSEVAERVMAAIRRAAHFIAAGESEKDDLANHHTMACLAVWKAYELLGDPDFKNGLEKLWKGFIHYHNFEEGWSREYDGVDPGYLSATVSFLAKIYQTNPDPAIFDVLRQSVKFCSYFVYPNGFYGGSLGSRNTLHFYPHGFELLADKIPLAAAIAEKMLVGLAEDKLVPPEIISDRYVVYRVPEFLQAYLDYTSRPAELPSLPYERESFTRYFPGARVFIATRLKHYVTANLAKGGVVKVFDRLEGRLLFNDCGLIGLLADGREVSSQWVDPSYECRSDEQGWEVSGYLHEIPSNKLFSPIRNILFRSVLVALGWSPRFSHLLKGKIRKTLMLGQRQIPVRFSRRLRIEDDIITLTDELCLDGDVQFVSLSVGDEFFVRYVPQSRYFQSQELDVKGYTLDESHVRALNDGQLVSIRQLITSPNHKLIEPSTQVMISTSKSNLLAKGLASLPKGVHDVDYFIGGKSKRQNMRQLRRPTDEVEAQLIYWEGQHDRRHPSDPVIAAFVKPKLQFVLKHVELSETSRILDVGCGNGYFTYYLERLGRTVGVDYADAMLMLNPCSNLVQASAFCLPLCDGTFDMVICSNLLHHVTDPIDVMAEMARVSNKYIVIHEPNRNNPAMLALGLAKNEERRSLRFTGPYLRSLALQVGLRVLACETMGFVTPNRMPRLIAKLASRFNGPNPFGAFAVLVARCDE